MFERFMPEIDRLSGPTGWINSEFVKRQRTPEFAIRVGIQFHLAGLSLSNTKQYLETLGVERSRTAIHDWVRKADLQPDSDVDPDQIAVDETLIRVNGQRHWLFAAVDPDSKPISPCAAVSDANDATHRAVSSRTQRETAAVERDVSRR